MDDSKGSGSANRASNEVGADDVQLWKEAVARVRVSQAMADQCGDPISGSALAQDDFSCPAASKISDAAHGTLFAALDNLSMWCDAVSPKVYVEGVVNQSSPRPHFTLARAGMESAAQVGWLLEPQDSATRVERHLRLVVADMSEEEKTANKLGAAFGAQVTRRIAALKNEVGAVKAAPNYLDVVRTAASHAGASPDQGEVLWRTASAATHGKLWFVGTTHTTTVGEEYRPGRFRVVHKANPDSVTAVVTFASKMVFWATALYAERLGFDVQDLHSVALGRVARDRPRSVPDTSSEVG